MATKTTVTCDECGNEPHGFWLALSCHETRTAEEMCQAVHRIPPIPGTLHFCGKDCLNKWMLNDWRRRKWRCENPYKPIIPTDDELKSIYA